MVINHDLLFDLDTGEFFDGALSLPVGYAHVLRLKFVKDGVVGYNLGGNGLIQLYFDQSFPVNRDCLLYTSPSPRDQRGSRMPSSA